jgi:outer membrane protein assembly factor BamD (BamD/ComL family)
MLETYPGSPEADTALIVLNKAYAGLEMPELADSAMDVLEYNDPDNPYVTGNKEKKGFWGRLWPF